MESNQERRDELTHVDIWSVAQRPSLGQPLIQFVSTLVCNAREAFVQQMIGFRKKQQESRADEVDLLQFPLRDWTAQVTWGPKTRMGPPKERIDSLLSTVPVFRQA